MSKSSILYKVIVCSLRLAIFLLGNRRWYILIKFCLNYILTWRNDRLEIICLKRHVFVIVDKMPNTALVSAYNFTSAENSRECKYYPNVRHISKKSLDNIIRSLLLKGMTAKCRRHESEKWYDYVTVKTTACDVLLFPIQKF